MNRPGDSHQGDNQEGNNQHRNNHHNSERFVSDDLASSPQLTTLSQLDAKYGGPAPTSELVQDVADWVVVGTGAGGASVARVLAEAGLDLVLIEEGPPVDRRRTAQNMYESAKHAYRDVMTFAATGRAFIPVLQGMCVGGGTAINSAIVWRIPDSGYGRAFDAYGLANDIRQADLESAYDFIESQLSVRPTQPDIAGRSNELMAKGAKSLGYLGQPIIRYEKDCIGSGLCQQACPAKRKQSLDRTFIPYTLAKGARLYATCRVEKLERQGTRITHVEGRFRDHESRRLGPRLRVEARKGVIIAANAVHSPVLLSKNGLGGKSAGRHFRAHPSAAIAGIYDEEIRPWTGATQGYEVLEFRDHGAKLESLMMPPELMGVRLPGIGKEYLSWLKRIRHIAVWGTGILADAEGKVGSGIFGVQANYNPSKPDIAKLRIGLKALAELHFAAGAKEVFPFTFGLPERLTSPDQLSLFDNAPLDPRAYSMIASHLFGTCRMGHDPKHSVVGPDFKVHGSDNLYVADASVFPSNIGVNPQHTIMAMAVLCGRRLLGG